MPNKCSLFKLWYFSLIGHNACAFSQKLLQKDDAVGVARYLHEYGDGLSKRRVGEYLGNMDDFNQRVLRAFLEAYDFKDITLDEAILFVVALPSFILRVISSGSSTIIF